MSQGFLAAEDANQDRAARGAKLAEYAIPPAFCAEPWSSQRKSQQHSHMPAVFAAVCRFPKLEVIVYRGLEGALTVDRDIAYGP